MNRLVQGDVGSGKTVVAVVAVLAAIQAGYQAALMAPDRSAGRAALPQIVDWFQLHLPVELLTGSTPDGQAPQAAGAIDHRGTANPGGHPCLNRRSGAVSRPGPGGDRRAASLWGATTGQTERKGNNPHVLTLTATPIPRTLSLTLHGDLEVSQIDELPPGRKAIQTTLLTGRDRTHAYDLIRREIALGSSNLRGAAPGGRVGKAGPEIRIDEHQRLQEVIFPDFTVGLLHGRMTSAEKDAAITAFRDGIPTFWCPPRWSRWG
jgi:ATP-dependent DNA helicase RecG